ncbi:hypothetical protein OKW22_001327 [Bacilli bacterium PM5-3]|nr:hypothetical protein [Bacilli bacterium PM5-3]MDH6604003.1 hypothetical protein [Bacilli bacterium PM5-9]
MNIYYEKTDVKVKVISFISAIVLIVGFLAAIAFALQYFDILKYYTSYHTYLKYAAIGLIVLGIILLIIKKIINKRKNVRFDGEVIKLCINNYVEHEFDLRKIDEIFNYRTNPEIPYGMQDALAFRFHKNDIWETVTSSLKNSKTKQSGVTLVKDINEAYAKIKSQRALAKMNSSQGVRFRYLSINNEKNSKEDYNNKLIEFEKTFKDYNNTYGGFDVERLVVTSDALYVNKHREATINDSDYVLLRKNHNNNETYFISDYLDFYNKNDELIISIDLTLVVNSELFKELCLSVFSKVE